MCMCKHICTAAWCVNLCTHVCKCMYVCIYIHIYIDTNMCTVHIYIFVYIHMCTWIHVSICRFHGGKQIPRASVNKSFNVMWQVMYNLRTHVRAHVQKRVRMQCATCLQVTSKKKLIWVAYIIYIYIYIYVFFFCIYNLRNFCTHVRTLCGTTCACAMRTAFRWFLNKQQ